MTMRPLVLSFALAGALVLAGMAPDAASAGPVKAGGKAVQGQQAGSEQCVGEGERCGSRRQRYCCPGLHCAGAFRTMSCKRI